MKTKYVLPVFMLFALFLAGCGSGDSTEPPPDIDALYTAAAETLGAQFTQQALDQPSSTPTPTLEIVLGTPTPTPTDSASAPTATFTQASGAPPAGPVFDACDEGEFVADITIPDGTEIAPGAVFTKTWEIKNVGTCAWNENYKVIFYFGERMAAESSYQLTTATVEIDSTVQISIQMTAPTQLGEYYSNWRMQNDKGEIFGLGANADAIFAQIKVALVSATNTATPENTPTETSPAVDTPTNTPETPTATTAVP